MSPGGTRPRLGGLRRAIEKAAGRLRRGRGDELPPRKAYALWAPHYPPFAHTLLMEIEETAVRELLPAARPRRVVDLGCGTGRYARSFASEESLAVGVDLSLEMLARAPGRFHRVQGDLCDVPLRDGCADLVVCGLTVGHVEDLAGAVAEIARVLAPGALAVYSDLHPGARARGWRRDFRTADGRWHAVAFTTHDEAAHREALRRAGLDVEAIREVGVGEPLARAHPEAARFRRRWGNAPVVLVVRARKP